MFTTFQKSAAALLLGVGALLVATGWAAQGEKATDSKNCCDLNLACCAEGRACCKDKVKAGCCEKGMACCKEDKACCAKAPDCCKEGKACCNEVKACCTKNEAVKESAAVPACCAAKTASLLDLTPGATQ